MLGRILLDIVRYGRSGAASLGQGALSDRREVATGPEIVPLDGINCLVKAKHGWFLANRHDLYLGGGLIRYGECCEIEHEFLTSLVSPGDWVIEAGSNIGTHTIGLAKAVGATGRVLSIEAQPAIFRVLCANLALNNISNVTTYGCGCGSGASTMIVPTINYDVPALHNSGGVSLTSSGNGIPVSVAPLDDLANDIPCLRLIKIDVEGMEQEVLKGASRLIEKHRPLIYVENDRIEKSEALIEHIMSSGYRLWWHMPPLFNPNNVSGIESNDYPNLVSINMLCQPAETEPSVATSLLSEIVDFRQHPLK